MSEHGQTILLKHPPYLPKIDHDHRKKHIFDEDFGFYTESYFREMLDMERKRTERSQKPIMLVMLDVAEIISAIPRKKIVEHFSSLLTDSARGIDIKGWYRFNHSIGIVYTEASTSGNESILKKVHVNLGLALGPQMAEKVIVTYALFPENRDNAGGWHMDDIRFYPSPYNRSAAGKASLILKRVIDVAGSIGLIVMFLPLFAVIAAAIKLTSKGPVFFTQTRIGRGGQPFRFIKFRSMFTGNDSSIHKEYVKKLIQGESGNAACAADGVYKIVNDPRVTPIGRFIRKTSLDELPQFFNVLKGDMALVGPRPPIPYELDNYLNWHKRRVLEAKPGITGFWQVSGRSTTTFDTMVRMDLQYVRRRSLWWDIKLILGTPLAVFKGAY